MKAAHKVELARYNIAVATAFIAMAASAVVSIEFPSARLLVFGVLGILAALTVPLRWVVPSLLMLRSFSDYGVYYQSPGNALTTGKLSAAIGFIAIFLAVARSWRTVSTTFQLTFLITALYLGFWTLDGYLHYGLQTPLIAESVRILSIVAIALVASAAAADPRGRPENILVAGVPAALLLIFAFVTRAPLMVDSSHRAFGAFSHPNSAVGFMAVPALIALALAWRGERHMRKRNGALAILFVLAAGTTQSLAGLAGLLVGLLVLGLVAGTNFGSRIRGFLLVAILLLLVLAFVPGISSRLDSLRTTESLANATSGITSNSLDWRFYNWSLLIGAWHHDPWVGYGIGATKTYIQPGGNLAHSVVVQLLVETGLVGALLACGAVIVLVVKAWRRASSGSDRYRSAIVYAVPAVLIAIGIQALAANTLGYTAEMFMLAAAVGYSWPGKQPTRLRGTAAALSPTHVAGYHETQPMSGTSASRIR